MSTELPVVKLVAYRYDQHNHALNEWIDDQETTRFMAAGRVPHVDPSDEWSPSDPGRDYVFAVHQGLAYVGVVGLYGVDYLSRKAELRILLGAARGRGVGTKACQLLVNFGFGRVNLERIWLGTAAGNLAAQRCFEKAGFLVEGLLRRDLYRDGWHDNYRMAILREEWEAARVKGME